MDIWRRFFILFFCFCVLPIHTVLAISEAHTPLVNRSPAIVGPPTALPQGEDAQSYEDLVNLDHILLDQISDKEDIDVSGISFGNDTKGSQKIYE